jgi:hypothetical protein
MLAENIERAIAMENNENSNIETIAIKNIENIDNSSVSNMNRDDENKEREENKDEEIDSSSKDEQFFNTITIPIDNNNTEGLFDLIRKRNIQTGYDDIFLQRNSGDVNCFSFVHSLPCSAGPDDVNYRIAPTDPFTLISDICEFYPCSKDVDRDEFKTACKIIAEATTPPKNGDSIHKSTLASYRLLAISGFRFNTITNKWMIDRRRCHWRSVSVEKTRYFLYYIADMYDIAQSH